MLWNKTWIFEAWEHTQHSEKTEAEHSFSCKTGNIYISSNKLLKFNEEWEESLCSSEVLTDIGHTYLFLSSPPDCHCSPKSWCPGHTPRSIWHSPAPQDSGSDTPLQDSTKITEEFHQERGSTLLWWHQRSWHLASYNSLATCWVCTCGWTRHWQPRLEVRNDANHADCSISSSDADASTVLVSQGYTAWVLVQCFSWYSAPTCQSFGLLEPSLLCDRIHPPSGSRGARLCQGRGWDISRGFQTSFGFLLIAKSRDGSRKQQAPHPFNPLGCNNVARIEFTLRTGIWKKTNQDRAIGF